MDENEILSSRNTPSRDSEEYFNNCDVTTSELDDDSKKEEKCKLDKLVSNHSLNDEFEKPQTNLNPSENENLDNVHASNNGEYGNGVSVTNAEYKSANSNTKENVNTDVVLNEKITPIEESVASNSGRQIIPTKELGISLDEEKRIIVLNENDETAQKSDFEVSSDEINIVDDVPENINAGETYNAKTNSDILDMIFPKHSDNDEEETIFNCDNPIQQTSSQSLVETLKKVEDKIDEDESLKAKIPNLNSADYLVRRKSIAELSTARTSKANSLAEDAKLVKFSVSSKSVNIMQSNAQFLNKSRNFLNFITEKSTNIMEKTLLPQNIAAKYNSILRLTENNPTNYKKCIEETGSLSDSVETNSTMKPETGLGSNCETSNRIAFNAARSDLQDTGTTNSHGTEQRDESVSGNFSLGEDPTKETEKLFPKCSVNENISKHTFTPKRQGMEITSEDIQQYSTLETPNIIDREKLSILDLGTTIKDGNIIESSTTCDSNSSDIILTPMPEEDSKLPCRDSDTDNVGIKETVSIKENEMNEVATSYRNESSATISPTLRTVSIENSNEEQIKLEDDGSETSKEQPIDLGLLAHPAYTALLRDYSNLKDANKKLSEVKSKVEMENQRLAAENSGELYALQLETLEKTIDQLRHDLKQATASQELINKEFLLANREKESMVMKYAMSEKQLIDTQRAREYAERKVNEALKEQELLHTKLKQVQGERTRICNILDGKCHELTDAQKEVDRLKEELSMREVKLKWTQNKLKTEVETHKDDQQKLDKAMLRINEMKEECEQVRKESQETIRKFQQSEENKVVTLDHQLKEQQARLILERHVTEDKESSRLQLQKEVETLKQRQHALIEENNTLSLKVQNLEKERLNYENNLSNLKVIADQRQKEIVDLVGKVSQLETLKLQLNHKEQLLSSNEAEVERLRQSNTELQSDMEYCRKREAHMLEFTQKLTDKNVRLQSEFTAMEAKNEQLELEQGPLHDQIKELSSKVKALEISLASEKSKRTEECELLARHVAEQTQLARNLAQKLEDSQGENAVLKRKQQISVKEMTKELQQCKKRLDAFETGSPSNSLDRTSRTGSSSSLSTGETLNGAVSDNSNSGDHILQSVEPDRQTLIDRIVKLQRNRVRQAEKLDFLEEHTRTLVNELQKKTKIIKNYILHENPDAMGSNERDRNKAELARHGGIMASVYNQRVSDDNMTLELSLEINQKLQAVLEDTLLKNITLKDSIDTLGGEIARLTMQNKRRQ